MTIMTYMKSSLAVYAPLFGGIGVSSKFGEVPTYQLREEKELIDKKESKLSSTDRKRVLLELKLREKNENN